MEFIKPKKEEVFNDDVIYIPNLTKWRAAIVIGSEYNKDIVLIRYCDNDTKDQVPFFLLLKLQP